MAKKHTESYLCFIFENFLMKVPPATEFSLDKLLDTKNKENIFHLIAQRKMTNFFTILIKFLTGKNK